MSSCCGPQKPETYITFRKGLDSSEALVLRSVLEAAGISVWLQGEHMASLNFAVRADLLIREADQGRAEQVLADVTPLHKVSPLDQGDYATCPHCGSGHVFPYVGLVPVWFGLMKSKAFPGSPWRKCLQCESFFRTDSNRIMGNVPLSLVWGGTLALIVWAIMWVINWLKVMV